MKTISWILFGLISFTSFIACHDVEIESLNDDSFRIYRISDYNSINQEIKRQIFHYNNNKLILVERYTGHIPEDSVMSCRTSFSYKNNLVTKSVFMNQNQSWIPHSVFQYALENDKIDYKLVSRVASPPCNECWKYDYYYSGIQITEWKKHIKTNDINWTNSRLGKYEYNNGMLTEYVDYVNYDNTTLKADYKIIYTSKNKQITMQLEGNYNSSNKWIASRKSEYFYVDNNINQKICYTMHPETLEWKQFGEINYYYSEDKSVIEESRSDGTRTMYYYEIGTGNASLFFQDIEDCKFTGPKLIL